MKRGIGILLIIAEAAGAIYAVFMSYLMTVWMESDAFAAHASDRDWWAESGKRVMIVILGAVLTATIVRLVNRKLFPLTGLQTSRMDLYSAIALFVLMVAAGAIGSIEFVSTRPFM